MRGGRRLLETKREGSGECFFCPSGEEKRRQAEDERGSPGSPRSLLRTSRSTRSGAAAAETRLRFRLVTRDERSAFHILPPPGPGCCRSAPPAAASPLHMAVPTSAADHCAGREPRESTSRPLRLHFLKSHFTEVTRRQPRPPLPHPKQASISIYIFLKVYFPHFFLPRSLVSEQIN